MPTLLQRINSSLIPATASELPWKLRLIINSQVWNKPMTLWSWPSTVFLTPKLLIHHRKVFWERFTQFSLQTPSKLWTTFKVSAILRQKMELSRTLIQLHHHPMFKSADTAVTIKALSTRLTTVSFLTNNARSENLQKSQITSAFSKDFSKISLKLKILQKRTSH